MSHVRFRELRPRLCKKVSGWQRAEQQRPSRRLKSTSSSCLELEYIGAQSRASYADNVTVNRYNGHITDTNLHVRPSNICARALAMLFWAQSTDTQAVSGWAERAAAVLQIQQLFGRADALLQLQLSYRRWRSLRE